MGDWQNRVIQDAIDCLILAPGRYQESFVFLSLLEVCRGGGPIWGYLKDIYGS